MERDEKRNIILLIADSMPELCRRDPFIALKHFAKITGSAESAFVGDVFNCSGGIYQ